MNNDAISEETWDDLEKRIFTPEEIAACESRVAITWEIRDARRRGIRKHDLEKLSGVNAAVISRMEEDPAKARLGPLLKVLTALGKTLAIVPIEEVLGELPAASSQLPAASSQLPAASCQLPALEQGK